MNKKQFKNAVLEIIQEGRAFTDLDGFLHLATKEELLGLRVRFVISGRSGNKAFQLGLVQAALDKAVAEQVKVEAICETTLKAGEIGDMRYFGKGDKFQFKSGDRTLTIVKEFAKHYLVTGMAKDPSLEIKIPHRKKNVVYLGR